MKQRLRGLANDWKWFLVGVLLLSPLVILALPDNKHGFAPVTVRQLRVEPAIIEVGKPATLFNGYCNNSNKPLNVQIYFGAQGAFNDPLVQPRSVDLLKQPDGTPVRDTAEGRIRQTLAPGCVQTSPIEIAAVPDVLDSGDWRLYLHLVVSSESNKVQNVSILSGVFIVAGH